ncbi:hypothetical protein LTS18_014827, partial [Coniosporium uncinatum]
MPSYGRGNPHDRRMGSITETRTSTHQERPFMLTMPTASGMPEYAYGQPGDRSSLAYASEARTREQYYQQYENGHGPGQYGMPQQGMVYAENGQLLPAARGQHQQEMYQQGHQQQQRYTQPHGLMSNHHPLQYQQQQQHNHHHHDLGHGQQQQEQQEEESMTWAAPYDRAQQEEALEQYRIAHIQRKAQEQVQRRLEVQTQRQLEARALAEVLAEERGVRRRGEIERGGGDGAGAWAGADTGGGGAGGGGEDDTLYRMPTVTRRHGEQMRSTVTTTTSSSTTTTTASNQQAQHQQQPPGYAQNVDPAAYPLQMSPTSPQDTRSPVHGFAEQMGPPTPPPKDVPIRPQPMPGRHYGIPPGYAGTQSPQPYQQPKYSVPHTRAPGTRAPLPSHTVASMRGQGAQN